ncbi:MAG: hypothetical protein L6R42_001313 [Xanthoria sp. 1 TBL-2021]|nr:MAG: hypothetical protein L6R42_001313 [Xanthoria sp. 1 TBL-2021]
MEHNLNSGRPPLPKKRKLGSKDTAQIERLQISMGLETSFPFLELPAEIRNEIYEMCLVVDGTINPYPVPYRDNNLIAPNGQSKPLVALLRVSKLLNAEARPILYGRNTWLYNQNCVAIRQNHAAFARQPFWDHLNSSRLAHTPMGHVIMTFSFRDLNQEELRPLYTTWARTQHLLRPGGNPQATAMKIAHSEHYRVLYNIWYWKAKRFVELVSRLHAPKRLTLDFTECYCHGGCCRPVGLLLDILMLEQRHWPPGFANDARKSAYMKRLRKIRIDMTGFLDEEESKCVGEKGFPARVVVQSL